MERRCLNMNATPLQWRPFLLLLQLELSTRLLISWPEAQLFTKYSSMNRTLPPIPAPTKILQLNLQFQSLFSNFQIV